MLPAGRGICKVSRRLQRPIHKLFSIVVRYCSDMLGQRSQAGNYCLADQVGSFAGDVREDCKPAFALHERVNYLFVAGADRRVAFPVTDLAACFNRSRTFGNGAPTNDLSATTLSAGVALTPLFLATKMFPRHPALCLVRVDVLVNRFVAHGNEGAICSGLHCRLSRSATNCRVTGSICKALRLAWARC